MTINTSIRPFPLPCAECGKDEVWPSTIAHDAEIKHDGRLYRLRINQLHVNQCSACGEVFFDHLTDTEISQALRTHLNLLSPQEIRDRLARLQMTQKEFGASIHVAAETISRWLSGAYIQSRAYDKLMRFFFGHVEEGRAVSPTGTVVITDGTLVPWSRPVSCPIADHFLPPEVASLRTESGPDYGDFALAV
jgi:DNA-binding transcriptional regulator YiaG